MWNFPLVVSHQDSKKFQILDPPARDTQPILLSGDSNKSVSLPSGNNVLIHKKLYLLYKNKNLFLILWYTCKVLNYVLQN